MSIYDERSAAKAYTGRVYCQKVRLNSQGYTYGRYPEYWGAGETLYCISDYDGLHSDHVRASCRDEALEKARAMYPLGIVSKR
jgi:hypothetical protein